MDQGKQTVYCRTVCSWEKDISSEQLCSPGNTRLRQVDSDWEHRASQPLLPGISSYLDSSLQTSPSYNRIIAALFKILSWFICKPLQTLCCVSFLGKRQGKELRFDQNMLMCLREGRMDKEECMLLILFHNVTPRSGRDAGGELWCCDYVESFP